jgi:hypothetical protein
MSPDLPTELTAFITRHLNSVEELEILLFLRKNEASSWTHAVISEQLHSSAVSARKRLEDLAEQELVKKEIREDVAHYQYAPPTEDLRARVSQLAELYPLYRIRIIQLIISSSAGRIQQIADAFKLREEDSNG